MRTVLVGLSVVLAACGGGETAAEPIVIDRGDPGGEQPPDEGREDTGGRLVVGTDACTSDADCVPAVCCHADACVARANAPACGDAVCTMECRYGTMDCGGGCLCHEGRCSARLSEMPSPEVR